MFIISAELYVFGTLIYLILASGKEQSWANGVGSKVSETLNEGQKNSKEPQGLLIDEKLDLPNNNVPNKSEGLHKINYGTGFGSVQLNSESTIKQ